MRRQSIAYITAERADAIAKAISREITTATQRLSDRTALLARDLRGLGREDIAKQLDDLSLAFAAYSRDEGGSVSNDRITKVYDRLQLLPAAPARERGAGNVSEVLANACQ